MGALKVALIGHYMVINAVIMVFVKLLNGRGFAEPGSDFNPAIYPTLYSTGAARP